MGAQAPQKRTIQRDVLRNTDDNGNAMFQSYISKPFKKKTAEDTLVPPLWGKRDKKFVFLVLFVHAAVCGGTCAFTLKFVNMLIKNSSRDDRPSIST